MAEFRQDLLTGDWVLLSPERLRGRPKPTAARRSLRKRFKPLLVDAHPVVGTREAVEVHKNLYPPFGSKMGTALVIMLKSRGDLVDANSGTRIAAATAFQELVETHARTSKHIVLFRNSGSDAGSSVALPHYQFWTLPRQTPAALRERAWTTRTKRCPTCALARSASRFIVARNSHGLLMARPAGRTGGELLVVPFAHHSSLTELSPRAFAALLALVATGVRRTLSLFPGVSFNEVWREWGPRQPKLHVRFEILPRLTTLGGLEVGESLSVNPYLPENIAVQLRRLSMGARP